MNLKDLADSYEKQFLYSQYKVTTINNIYYIQGKADNFLHLTGVEDSYQFRSNTNAFKFYYDCKNGKHLVVPTQLNYPKPKYINVVDIKTRNFFRMKNSILSAKTLYNVPDDKHDGLAISEPFKIGNKIKYCTLLFSYNPPSNILHPMSLQIDQSQGIGIIPKAISQEPIVYVEEINNPSEIDDTEKILVSNNI